jgi:tetratricopeptide (TPR) repeat protein
MTNSEKDVEFIERYIEGELTPEEKKDFEERLAVDEVFESTYLTYRNLIEGIQYSGKQKLIQRLKKLEANISVQETFDKRIMGIRMKDFYSYSAAATVLLLITFSFIFIINDKPTANEIYTEYFQPYPNVVNATTRGEESVLDPKEQAYRYYDLEEYEKAVVAFENILKKEKDPAVLLYAGNSYLALGKFNTASAKLKSLDSLDSPFDVQAQWYLAMSYLANKNSKEGKIILNKIKAQNVSYSKKAQDILNTMK